MLGKSALLLCVLLSLVGSAVARNSPRKNILDYFMALDVDRQFGPRTAGPERVVEIEEKDLRRGYLRLREVHGDKGEMKLFRLPDGTSLLGQVYTGCCCGGSCNRGIRFLADRNGRFEDVTEKVWPGVSLEQKEKVIEQSLKPNERFLASNLADQAVYRLPSEAAAVEIRSRERVIMTFTLAGGRFVRR